MQADQIPIIRSATPADVPEILTLIEQFVDESLYNVTFDADVSRFMLMEYINTPHWDLPLVVTDDALEMVLGGALLAKVYEFSGAPLGYISKMFIRAEGRRSTAGRVLVQYIDQWAKAGGCSHLFCTATAGLGPREQALFVNLTRKAGYADVGPVLCKELQLWVFSPRNLLFPLRHPLSRSLTTRR